MPKSTSKAPLDNDTRSADSDERKKKNAKAQAAFRARRANYIDTLEEAVTNLESVVWNLQMASRESLAEVQDLRQQNARLRLQVQERERYWKAFYRTRKPDDDLGQLPAAMLLPSNTAGPVGQSPFQYQEEHFNYRSDDSCQTVFNGSEHSYAGSPSIPIAEPHIAADATHQTSQSPPVYVESEMSFPSRSFGAPEEQKVALQSVLETAPYSFSIRPLSPLQSRTWAKVPTVEISIIDIIRSLMER
ncbi:hypothetical protein MD484_g212, partial [Candolleomyces efflorescens]